jgi:ABC-2 type transport system permease protein
MISFPLLKQSIKANKNIWLVITVATSFMLATIIFVTGNINVGELRDSFTETFTKSEIESQIKINSIDTFVQIDELTTTIYPEVKDLYDLSTGAISTYDAIKASGSLSPKEDAIATIVSETSPERVEMVTQIVSILLDQYELESPDEENLVPFKASFITNIILSNLDSKTDEQRQQIIQMISESIVHAYSVNNSLSTEELQLISSNVVRLSFSFLIDQETLSFFEEYGFDLEEIDTFVNSSLLQYIALINNGIDSESAKTEISKSILSQMPEEVTNSLNEIVDLNIDHLVVGTIFFKIAGLLLPLVYVIVTSNSLLAGQIDSGSMAYVLSTPTKRKVVTFTQITYMVLSLFVMYFIILIAGLLTIKIVNDPDLMITAKDLSVLTVGAFTTMLSISGINFLTSAWFNKSKNATGLGGGISIFFLVSTILGLLGSPVIPSAIRIDALNFFNYFSLITLYDVIAILEGAFNYLNMAVLLSIGITTFTLGHIIFNKKDLPL